MRLGELTKGTASSESVDDVDAESYLNSTLAEVGEAVLAAVRWCERYTGAALDRAQYTLSIRAGEAGDFILLPRWHGIELSGTSATDGTELDPLVPVVTVGATALTNGAGTLTVTAGYGNTDLPKDIRNSVLYVAAQFFDGQVPDRLPALVAAPLDSIKRTWRDYHTPREVRNFDSERGTWSEVFYR